MRATSLTLVAICFVSLCNDILIIKVQTQGYLSKWCWRQNGPKMNLASCLSRHALVHVLSSNRTDYSFFPWTQPWNGENELDDQDEDSWKRIGSLLQVRNKCAKKNVNADGCLRTEGLNHDLPQNHSGSDRKPSSSNLHTPWSWCSVGHAWKVLLVILMCSQYERETNFEVLVFLKSWWYHRSQQASPETPGEHQMET